MDAFSVMSSCSRSRPPRTRSLDSGVDVLVEINFDDSQPSSETEETRDDKQNLPSDRTSPELKGGSSNELSDPDATEELKVCPLSVIPEADAGSIPAVPPPLPPKFYKKTSASEKTISQGTTLKALTEDDESVNSYQRLSLTGRVKGFSQSSDGEIPTHNTFGTVPEPQSKPSLPPKPPKKPPRLHISNWQQRCERDEVQGESEKRSPPQPKPKPRKQSPALRDRLEEVKVTERWRQVDSLDTRTTRLDVEGTKGAAEIEMTSQRGETLSEAAQTLCHRSQLPATESQDIADGQSSPGPGPLHGTEELNLEPRQLGDAQEPGETEVERQLKQTQKARIRLKQLAKNIVCRFKDRREEKRRNKTEEANPAAVTQEETEPWEGGGVKEEDWMDGNRERPTTQSRFKKRQEASESPFGSFKVYSPTALFGDLLLDDTWSRLLSPEQSLSPESSQPPTRLSDSLPSGSSPEVVLSPDLLRVHSVAAEKEFIYEDVNISGFNLKEMNRAASSGSLVERSDLSFRTDDIYETVELIQPLRCRDIFTTAKSHGNLDSSVQKYLIKLNKERKHKRKRHRAKRHRHTDAFGSSTSLQIFSSSVFYHAPGAGGGEEQLHTVTESECEVRRDMKHSRTRTEERRGCCLT